jgi:hypothetical protein
MSVSALLAEVVRNAERDAIFSAERRASRADCVLSVRLRNARSAVA